MEREEPTLERVRTLIGEVCAVDKSMISKKARLRGYGIDSIRVMELIMFIEDEFHIHLEIEPMAEIATAGELAEYIDSLRSSK